MRWWGHHKEESKRAEYRDSDARRTIFGIRGYDNEHHEQTPSRTSATRPAQRRQFLCGRDIVGEHGRACTCPSAGRTGRRRRRTDRIERGRDGDPSDFAERSHQLAVLQYCGGRTRERSPAERTGGTPEPCPRQQPVRDLRTAAGERARLSRQPVGRLLRPGCTGRCGRDHRLHHEHYECGLHGGTL